MVDFSVSWLPLLTIALANFLLSWLYYSPAVPWFKAWLIGAGQDPNKKEMTAEDKKAMPRLMGGAVVSSLLLSYGLQVFVRSVNAVVFGTGALVGLAAWLAFAVTHSLNSQFEGRKPVVLVINNVLYLLTYAVFGGLFAVWR
jgi:hypothetical protein